MSLRFLLFLPGAAGPGPKPYPPLAPEPAALVGTYRLTYWPDSVLFADLTYRYTLPTARKMDLEVRWNNIFDTRQYQYGFVNQFSLVQNTCQLRPAQVLAVVRLSL